MYRIGILGSYGGHNLGDEAILHAMTAELRSAVPCELTVFTSDPDHTQRFHGVDRAVKDEALSREQLLPHLERLDLLIVGGGGILFDKWIRDHIHVARLAEARGIPVMVFAVGVGPLLKPDVRDAVRALVDSADVVTVRDESSHRTLEQLGVECEVIVTADPALLLAPEPLPEAALEREGMRSGRNVIGFSVREPGPAAPDLDVDVYHAQLASAADYMVERLDTDIVFVPFEREERDMQHAHAVVAQMHRPQRATVLKGDYSPGQMLSLVGEFTFCVGMRLHFLLFSAIQRVPFVALPYAAKVMGFVEALGMETPPLADLTIGQLIAYIDRAWDRQSGLRRSIDRGVPQLQERARENTRIAVGLLTGNRAASAVEAPTRG